MAGTFGRGVARKLVLDGVGRAWIFAPTSQSDPTFTQAFQAPDEEWRRAITSLLSRPESLPNYTSLKYSPTNSVYRVELGFCGCRVDVVCKQNAVAGLRRRFARWIGRTRERRHIRLALRLGQVGIPTAQPIAMVETDRPLQVISISQYLPDILDLDRVCLTILNQPGHRGSTQLRAALAPAIAVMIASLNRARLHHRDLKASNVLLFGSLGEPDRISAGFVDMEGLRGAIGIGSALKMLRRLAASLVDHAAITRTDFARLLIAFLRETQKPVEIWKLLFRRISDGVRRNASGSQRRKRGKLDGFARG